MMKKTVESKALGIPLTEDVARQVDDIVKTLPQEYRHIRHKGSLPETELVKGERADISMVSTETVDRDGDVILSKGMDLEAYQRNPIVTLAHKYDELPVGRAAWVKKVSGGLRAKTVYSEATEIARNCWTMTQEGILRGKSIGFLPTKVRSFSQEEISKNPQWKDAGACIESGLLLEYAVCAIPVNPTSLVEAVAKGRVDRITLERLGFCLPQVAKRTPQQVAEFIAQEMERRAKELTPERIRAKMLSYYRA